MNNILDRQFRSNPAFELFVYDRLPPEIQQNVPHTLSGAGFYGVLVPGPGSGYVAKAVDQDTALLFYTLQQPGLLPGYVRVALGEQCNPRMVELVLEGVLEVAVRPGEFLSGASALHLTGAVPPRSPAGENHIAQLSYQALLYAQTLLLQNSAMLSARLYHYNTVPVTAAWRCRIPDHQAALIYLGLQPGGRNERAFGQAWRSSPAGQLGEGWHFWQRRHPHKRPHKGSSAYDFKLYFSPLPEALPEAIPQLVEGLSAAPVQAFKIGSSAHGLLRPDKIVAYCATFEALAEAGAALENRLSGCPAQGVPFTASISHSGLLSWGTDPPSLHPASENPDRESWRLWVTNQLAAALVEARAGEPGESAAQFALERLRLQGVEIETWTPRQGIWHEGQGMP
jgi:hypothetical protein